MEVQKPQKPVYGDGVTDYYLDQLRSVANKRHLENKRKLAQDKLARKKRARGQLANQSGEFSENQESQCIEKGNYIFVRPQKVSKLPQLDRESIAMVPDEADRSITSKLSSISRSDSSVDIFKQLETEEQSDSNPIYADEPRVKGTFI